MDAGALRHRVVGSIARALRGHPQVLSGIRSAVRSAALQQDILKHTAARVLPQIIQPDPKEIFLTLTANCNLRCKGVESPYASGLHVQANCCDPGWELRENATLLSTARLSSR